MKTLIIAAIFFYSCSTTKLVEQQRGTVEVYNGKIQFTPLEEWQEYQPKNTPDTLFRVRTIAVKKQKP